MRGQYLKANYYNLFLVSLITLFLAFSARAGQNELYQQGLVVSSQPLASEVGMQILRDGGNAVDAAVAVGYALAVVDPCCGNIGGGGFMVVHIADDRNIVINFRETAPAKISPLLYLNDQGQKIKGKLTKDNLKGGLDHGYLAVAVPGTVMGLNTALLLYGSMPLEKIMAPAIKLARQGFIVTPRDTKYIKMIAKYARLQPNLQSVFLKNDKPLQEGERLVQKDLANSLNIIATKGTKAFYRGQIADQLVKTIQANGGIITKQDLAQYNIRIQKPILCRYRGYQLILPPPPSSGGVAICEILNIVEAYPLKKWGFYTPKSLHYLVEAMRYAFHDRNQYLGDPSFVNNPIARLTSKKYAGKIRDNIKSNTASASLEMPNKQWQPGSANTTHYSVVDKDGNAVAVTYTINALFGAKVVPGKLGFFLNNELDDFTLKPGIANAYGLIQGEANSMAPGKRPLSSMTPTIVLKNKKPFLILGAAGGSTIITQVALIIINVIDYGMTIQQAINNPRIHMQSLPDKIYYEADALNNNTIQKLQAMGYTLNEGSLWGGAHWGVSNGIMLPGKGKKAIGSPDKRLNLQF